MAREALRGGTTCVRAAGGRVPLRGPRRAREHDRERDPRGEQPLPGWVRLLGRLPEHLADLVAGRHGGRAGRGPAADPLGSGPAPAMGPRAGSRARAPDGLPGSHGIRDIRRPAARRASSLVPLHPAPALGGVPFPSPRGGHGHRPALGHRDLGRPARLRALRHRVGQPVPPAAPGFHGRHERDEPRGGGRGLAAPAGRGGSVAKRRHRGLLPGRHRRQDPRRHHRELEPRGRAPLRVFGGRGGRPQHLDPGPPQPAGRDPADPGEAAAGRERRALRDRARPAGRAQGDDLPQGVPHPGRPGEDHGRLRDRPRHHATQARRGAPGHPVRGDPRPDRVDRPAGRGPAPPGSRVRGPRLGRGRAVAGGGRHRTTALRDEVASSRRP